LGGGWGGWGVGRGGESDGPPKPDPYQPRRSEEPVQATSSSLAWRNLGDHCQALTKLFRSPSAG